jgi:hypothetical protein
MLITGTRFKFSYFSAVILVSPSKSTLDLTPSLDILLSLKLIKPQASLALTPNYL